MASLRAQIESLQQQLTVALARIEKLERENCELRKAKEELKTANEELKTAKEELKTANEELKAANAALKRERDELLKKVTGRTSERAKGGGPSKTALKKAARAKNDAKAQAARAENKAAREKACVVEEVDHKLADTAKAECGFCGGAHMTLMVPEVSAGDWEFVPGRLVRRRHRREKAICGDCGKIVRAPAPERFVDGSPYGPGLVARVVVQKLADCLPFHRQARMWEREGLTISRATLKDLFHNAASLLLPLYTAMLALVAEADVVFADETSLKLQDRKKSGFVWVFSCETVTIYKFATGRSGETPVEVLGDSVGPLIVDGYSGYNVVCTPERRIRSGCNGHARRKFVDIDDEQARHVIELYQTVWEVEREAAQSGIAGTDAHLALRQSRSREAMDAIKAWRDEHRGRYGPKQPLGKAITYLTNQWEYLTRFLDDVRIPPDNNLSERLLRLIALGRKNYLFVGNEDAGKNLATLMSLVVTCVQHDVNPQEYLTDVLVRIQSHPASAVRELLPDAWKAARDAAREGQVA